MVAAAILKIAFLAMSDFSEILYEQAERHVGKSYGTKKMQILKSKMADSHHFENRQVAISQ